MRRSKSWSRRDRVRRRGKEGGLEDRSQARCWISSWESDNVAEGLQAGAEEENEAWSQVIRDWVGHHHNQTAEDLKPCMVKTRANVIGPKKKVCKSLKGSLLAMSCILLLSLSKLTSMNQAQKLICVLMVLLFVLLILSLSEIPDVLQGNQIIYFTTHPWPWCVSSLP